MKTILNRYIKNPLLWDFFLILIILGVEYLLCSRCEKCLQFDLNAFGDLTTELISASVSIGGFIITALTIILAFREKTEQKPLQESRTGMELLMNSNAYSLIIRVFSQAAFVFLFTFILFIALMILRNHLSGYWQFRLIITGSVLSIMSVFRCLIILQRIVLVKFTGR